MIRNITYYFTCLNGWTKRRFTELWRYQRNLQPPSTHSASRTEAAAPVLFWRSAPGLSTPSPTVLMDGRRYQRALEASQGLWNHCSRSTNTLHVVKLSEIFFITKTKLYQIRTIIWLAFQNFVSTNYDLFVICFHFRYMINNNLHANWTAFRLIKELKGCLTSMP